MSKISAILGSVIVFLAKSVLSFKNERAISKCDTQGDMSIIIDDGPVSSVMGPKTLFWIPEVDNKIDLRDEYPLPDFAYSFNQFGGTWDLLRIINFFVTNKKSFTGKETEDDESSFEEGREIDYQRGITFMFGQESLSKVQFLTNSSNWNENALEIDSEIDITSEDPQGSVYQDRRSSTNFSFATLALCAGNLGCNVGLRITIDDDMFVIQNPSQKHDTDDIVEIISRKCQEMRDRFRYTVSTEVDAVNKSKKSGVKKYNNAYKKALKSSPSFKFLMSESNDDDTKDDDYMDDEYIYVTIKPGAVSSSQTQEGYNSDITSVVTADVVSTLKKEHRIVLLAEAYTNNSIQSNVYPQNVPDISGKDGGEVVDEVITRVYNNIINIIALSMKEKSMIPDFSKLYLVHDFGETKIPQNENMLPMSRYSVFTLNAWLTFLTAFRYGSNDAMEKHYNNILDVCIDTEEARQQVEYISDPFKVIGERMNSGRSSSSKQDDKSNKIGHPILLTSLSSCIGEQDYGEPNRTLKNSTSRAPSRLREKAHKDNSSTEKKESSGIYSFPVLSGFLGKNMLQILAVAFNVLL